MKYIVRFYSSKEDIEQIFQNPQSTVELGWTEMYINRNCNKGDTIKLDFPSIFLKNNPWFRKLPLEPYKIHSIYTDEKNSPELFVYYVGDLDLKKLKWS
ncbi:unnamed protein product [Chrysoparadoxa australica]